MAQSGVHRNPHHSFPSARDLHGRGLELCNRKTKTSLPFVLFLSFLPLVPKNVRTLTLCYILRMCFWISSHCRITRIGLN